VKRHAFVRCFERAWGERDARRHEVLRALDRSFTRLDRLGSGAPAPAPGPEIRALRRALEKRADAWTDGDENLVHADLGDWSGRDATHEGYARRLLATADHLVQIRAAPGSLFYFAWLLASAIGGIEKAGAASRSPLSGHRSGRRTRIPERKGRSNHS
jgi:hypothetical protein